MKRADPSWRHGSTLTVLGGSSPFTVVLADELVASNLPPGVIVLCGRDQDALSAVSAYVAGVLDPRGWTVRTTTDLVEGLDGASVVLHQIRYGGLEGRGVSEEIALRSGLPADETLGPSGIFNALTTSSGIAAVAREISQAAPDAVVLNITNPLSISTALMIGAGCERVLGLCELPQATFDEACRVLSVRSTDVEWSYAGLNHRGFVYGMRDQEEDLIEALAQRPDLAIGGIRAPIVHRLHALPLKYHGLLEADGDEGSHGIGRAEQLRTLRADVLRELFTDPTHRPASLDRRPCLWYRISIVPALQALAGRRLPPQVVNVRTKDNIVREIRASIRPDGGVDPLPAGTPPDAVAGWMDTFDAHEAAMLDLVASPGAASLRRALQADPLVPSPQVEVAAAAVEWGLRTSQPGSTS